MRRLLPLLLVAACAPLAAAEPAKLEKHFQPLAYLVGHCWRAPFADGKQRDLQCFESMYNGKLISNTHMVQGSDPLYEGTSIFSWDAQKQRIRFHYFTSTGAVSEGWFEPDGEGMSIPEHYTASDGRVIEIQNDYRRDGEYAYRVVTREKKGDKWEEVRNLRYVRTDAPEAPKEKAALQHDGAQWLLAWSTHRDGNWEVYRQDADGMQSNLTKRESNEWAWNARGDTLLILSNERKGDEPRGWRGYRMAGDAMTRVSDDVLADGYVDCTPDGSTCAGERMIEGRKRIALFDRSGKQTALVASERGDDADPHFSPDGKRMLFRSSRGGHFDIYVGDTQGRDAKQLTNDVANDSANRHEYGGEGPAHFSPDGERIVWMRKFADRGYDVWTMRTDGSEQTNLTQAHDGSDAYPSWSPDGKQIAFDSDRDGTNEIYVMDADGGNVRRITMSPGGNLAPMWVRVAAK